MLDTGLGLLHATFPSILRGAPKGEDFADEEIELAFAQGHTQPVNVEAASEVFPLWSLCTMWLVPQERPLRV